MKINIICDSYYFFFLLTRLVVVFLSIPFVGSARTVSQYAMAAMFFLFFLFYFCYCRF